MSELHQNCITKSSIQLSLPIGKLQKIKQFTTLAEFLKNDKTKLNVTRPKKLSSTEALKTEISSQTAFRLHSDSIQTAFRLHSDCIQTAFKRIRCFETLLLFICSILYS